MPTFAEAKLTFDKGPGKARALTTALVPVDGKQKKNIPIRNAKGEPFEEFYKWQFIHGLIHSGLYARDYIGAEVRFPKGNKASAPLRLDAAIFDDPEWLQHYNDYWQQRSPHDLEWLNAHLLAVSNSSGTTRRSRKSSPDRLNRR